MASNNLPPIPREQIGETYGWRDWFNKLGIYIQKAQVGDVPWTILQGGTGANNVNDARNNLGLGSIATQNYNNVNITGGEIDNVNMVGASLSSATVSGSVSLTNSTATTVGATGSASSLPTLPVGYVIININGTNYKLPYYNT